MSISPLAVENPIVIETPLEMFAHSAKVWARGGTIGLVPTMGALHEGHLSLIEYARTLCDELVVSIFVNPLQFNQESDLDNYPRTWDADLAACASLGTDVIYAPNPGTMYPEGYQSKVEVGELTASMEGECRPGHFSGMTTVVAKLFNAVRPRLAVFGEKDFQQLAVVKRMALDLDMGIEVVGRPTVREPDGLAMSSRNKHLSPQERSEALCIWRGLDRARRSFASGERDVEKLLAAARLEIESSPKAKLEYLELVNPDTLQPVEGAATAGSRICVAMWMGKTRLIDNAALA